MEDDVTDTELLKRLSGPHTRVIYSTSSASSHPENKKIYRLIFVYFSFLD